MSFAAGAGHGAANDFVRREPRVHDPSTIVKCADEYWFFATGRGIYSRSSQDLASWQDGPRVFANPPAWTTQAVAGFRDHFWAPDVIHFNDRCWLYYSVSTWGKNTSAIGLATNGTLNPARADYRWVDQGPVIESGRSDNFNAIDPAVFRDVDGKLWLSFGSFWSGIKLVQLDPATGKRIAPNSPLYSLAHHDSIEAPFICRRQGRYYLFVNWGQCCRGTNSTYEIRVGRSPRVTGPYVDKDGRDLLRGGGSLVLGSQDAFIGPGHASILADGGVDWFVCHYYDGRRRGAATLSIRRLEWNADGWPVVLPESRGVNPP